MGAAPLQARSIRNTLTHNLINECRTALCCGIGLEKDRSITNNPCRMVADAEPWRPFPIVVQFNKRDLPDIRSRAELQEIAERGQEPLYEAVAIQGDGVLETFHGLLEATWESLEQKHEINRKFGLSKALFLESVFKDIDSDSLDLEGCRVN